MKDYTDSDERFVTRGLCPKCNRELCDIDLDRDFEIVSVDGAEYAAKTTKYRCNDCHKRWSKDDLLPENRPKLTKAQREAMAWMYITGSHRKKTHHRTRNMVADVTGSFGYRGGGDKVTEEIREHYKLGNLPLMQVHMSLVAVGFEVYESSKWITYFRDADYACVSVHPGGYCSDHRCRTLFGSEGWTERGMALLVEAKRKPRPSIAARKWLTKAWEHANRYNYGGGLCLVCGDHESPAVLELVELGLVYVHSRELDVKDEEPTMYHSMRLNDCGSVLAQKVVDEDIARWRAERQAEDS